MSGGLRVWHLTEDASRQPRRVSAGDGVTLGIGTWPVAEGQSVWVTLRTSTESTTIEQRVEAKWERNEGSNSYWTAALGSFPSGQRIEYTVWARDEDASVEGPSYVFEVGPKIHLALLWHQHQPMYRVATASAAEPLRLQQPWVRLHALRDYYSMAALVAEEPDIHLTINLTPVLLSQIDDYVERGATDRALELTLKAASKLNRAEREELLASFFDADWHRQIFVHGRYRELFEKRTRGERFTSSDLRDLQMWFNLAWFNKQFRDGPVELATGETVDVHQFVHKGRGFSMADVRAMVAEQLKVMRAVVPLHRVLQERGQLEVSTTPFTHPILPLLIDTDQATIDLEGASLPRRFAHPEDAEEQVRLAVADYQARFGKTPSGMWPAEGAVSRASVPVFAGHGVRWIATDRGVLARSGRWGYDVDDPDVLCHRYEVGEEDARVSIFFRDTALSDAIGFRYQYEPDPEVAASKFVAEIEARFARRFTHDEDRLVTVILDGENAWGGYVDDGRPFLRALYSQLANNPSIQTVTFAEYLGGNPVRAIAEHPPAARVHDLFTASWIDEVRSRPGVDLGTWIGEPEENQAWELLGRAREAVDVAPRSERAAALPSIYAAEGSDWFWWFGDDQDSGRDEQFDELFRAHLMAVYRALGEDPPTDLHVPLVERRIVWSFAQPVSSVLVGDLLIVRTNCQGNLVWSTADQAERTLEVEPVGGVLAGSRRFQAMLGRVPPGADAIRFRFTCTDAGCDHRHACCQGEPQSLRVDPRGASVERAMAAPPPR